MWTLEAIAECLTRRARKQHDPEVGPSRERALDSAHANAWYGTSASRGGGRREQPAAVTRCDAVLDSGRTRGDDREETSVCLHFARGRCAAGGECAFLHRLPTAVDDARASLTHDVFGRARHATDRADNGGVGSFEKLNVATLFAHYGGAFPPLADAERVRAAVLADFLEWGPVSDVRALPTRCVAFVTYAHRSAAEFAKEAMAGQTLRASEARARDWSTTEKQKHVLTVRWANDDPNPAARAAAKRVREETGLDAFARVLENPRAAPEWRLALAQARALATRPDAYPDTDAQYPRGTSETVTAAPEVFFARNSPTNATKTAKTTTPKRAAPPETDAIDALELERFRAAVGVVAAAPARTSGDADDEDAFDPDDYPEFEVEEV